MEIFRKEMKLNGLRIKDVAEIVGVTPTNVQAWLSGVYRPAADKIKALRAIGFSDAACLEPSKDIEI